TLYVRLTSTINGVDQSNDYTYKAFTAGAGCGTSTLATMSSPPNGATLGATQSFAWNAGCNATKYFLYVGSTQGAFDLYFQDQGLNLSTPAPVNLPTDGRTLYVRLWTLFNGVTDIANGWQFKDYTYTAAQ